MGRTPRATSRKPDEAVLSDAPGVRATTAMPAIDAGGAAAAILAAFATLPAGDRLRAIELLIAQLDPAEAEQLAHKWFTPSALRRRRLLQRDRLVLELAGHLELAASGREMARRLRSWLLRIAATPNLMDDPRHELARRILATGDGRVPSVTIVRAILAGRQGVAGFFELREGADKPAEKQTRKPATRCGSILR